MSKDNPNMPARPGNWSFTADVAAGATEPIPLTMEQREWMWHCDMMARLGMKPDGTPLDAEEPPCTTP